MSRPVSSACSRSTKPSATRCRANNATSSACRPASGGGISPAIPLLGAIAGGVLGSAVANGHHNQQAGAAIGAVFGGAVGYDVARRNATPRYVTYGTQEVCSEVQDTHEEERISGYNVRYTYLGQTYTTYTRNPPGDTVRVRVDVTPAF